MRKINKCNLEAKNNITKLDIHGRVEWLNESNSYNAIKDLKKFRKIPENYPLDWSTVESMKLENSVKTHFKKLLKLL